MACVLCFGTKATSCGTRAISTEPATSMEPSAASKAAAAVLLMVCLWRRMR
jgi:hypothetical protein